MKEQSHSIAKAPEPIVFSVAPEQAGQRLDQFLAGQIPQHSRTRLQGWVRDGRVRIDAEVECSPSRAIAEGMCIVVEPAVVQDLDTTVRAEAIPIDVVYEDDDLIVINKPAGLTVHPGAGQPVGTLQNALLHHRPSLAALPRSGIVHRLDKLTTGLMIVAASLEAHTQLVRDLAAREIHREYLALVWGDVIAGGTVDAPLARDPRDRRRYVVANGGRDARTHFRVEERFRRHTLLRLQLETGRTHQIRVHMQHRRLPLVGDPVYGRRGDPLRAELPRQALHATRLELCHPGSGEVRQFEQPLPEDMQSLLAQLRAGEGSG